MDTITEVNVVNAMRLEKALFQFTVFFPRLEGVSVDAFSKVVGHSIQALKKNGAPPSSTLPPLSQSHFLGR